MATSSCNGFEDLKWTSDVTSPFNSLSRKMYPKTMRDVFTWSQELWLHHGIYSQAISKAVRYFMTEIEVFGDEELDFSSRKKYAEQLKKTYDLKGILSTIGDDFIGYGNSFTSLHIPFIRNLVCPECGTRAPISRMTDFFEFKDYKFIGKCPKDDCTFHGEFQVKDLRVTQEDLKVEVIRWPPQYIKLKWHPITNKKIYYLDVSAYSELVDGIKSGDPIFLAETPMEIIEAVKENKELEFAEGVLFHMANTPMAYALPDFKGWGVPHFMAEFETVIAIMLLDKYNEMIVSDYLMPFRVLSPPSQGNTGATQTTNDPMLNIGMGNFVGNVKRMIDGHRNNPTDWNFLPFPVQYQALGAEGKDLAPVELMEHFEQRLLHSMGIPQEMYSGSIQNSAAPIIGFRMFERTWQHFATELDAWLTWFVRKQGELFKWEKISARLIPVSIYEDPDIRALKIDLAASNQVSKDTAFRSIGLDADYEARKVLDEQEEYEELLAQQSIEKEKKDINQQAVITPPPGQQMLEQEQAAAQGGMAPGGAPMPMAGGGAPMPPGGMAAGVQPGGSIDEIMMQADQIAQTLLTMEPSQRKSELINLKKTNETLHAQVKSRLETLEQQAGQHGVNLARAGQIPTQ